MLNRKRKQNDPDSKDEKNHDPETVAFLESAAECASLSLFEKPITAASTLKKITSFLYTQRLIEIELINHDFTPFPLEKNFFELLSAHPTLRKIDLGRCIFTSAQAKTLCLALQKSNLPHELILSRMGAEAFGFKNVIALLHASSNLLVLDLSSSYLNSTHAKHLAKALKTNPTLIKLNLSGNLITNSGAIAIFNALQQNSRCALQELDLNSNGGNLFGLGKDNKVDDALKACANFLTNNRTLKSLSLMGNPINDKKPKNQFPVIFKALESNQSLTTLFWTHTSLTLENSDAQPLRNLLQNNQHLTELNLHGVETSLQAVNGILVGLAQNKALRTLHFEARQKPMLQLHAFYGLIKKNSELLKLLKTSPLSKEFFRDLILQLTAFDSRKANLTNLYYGEPEIIDQIKSALTENNKTEAAAVKISRIMAFSLSFFRANHGSALRNSRLPLFKTIIEPLLREDEEGVKFMKIF